jgi:hypothetical protein
LKSWHYIFCKVAALTGILGLATKNAMIQSERVAVELGEIEEDARIARAMIDNHPVERPR